LKNSHTEKYFKKIFKEYDFWNALFSLGLVYLWYKALLQNLKNSKSVGDIGSGTGTLTHKIANLPFIENIKAIEPSLEMLSQMKPHSKIISFHQCFEDSLKNIKDVDTLVFSFVFRNLSSEEKILLFKEAQDKKILILDFFRPKNHFLNFFIKIYTLKIMPFVASLKNKEFFEAYVYLGESIQKMPTAKELTTSWNTQEVSGIIKRKWLGGLVVLIELQPLKKEYL